MAGWPKNENKTHDNIRNGLGSSTKRLKCLQINVQHSRVATDNLVKIMEEEDKDIVSIQQPYNIGSTISWNPTHLHSTIGRRREEDSSYGNKQQKSRCNTYNTNI